MMNKRICIFGILLFIFGIVGGGMSFESSLLFVVGPIVTVIGALINDQKVKD